MTTIVTIDMGGTGATHAAGAREALSVPSLTDMGSSYAQANSAYDQANTAYSQANSGYAQANSAYETANGAYASANLAYAAANNSNLKTGGLITGTLNVTQDIIIGGNVYLEGNTTYINVATYSVEDSLIYLASNNDLTDSVDIGFMGGKNTSGTYAHTGLARDATDGKWKLFDGLAEEGHVGNVVDFANTYLATLVANVEANTLSVVNGVSGNVNFDSGTLFIDSAGNSVGIGTSSPAYKLDTNNTTEGTIARFVNGTGRGYVRMDGYDDITLQFYRRGASVGFLQTDGSGAEFLGGTTNAYPFIFYTNNSEKMRLDSSGNLGIGTSSPTWKLDINGATDILRLTGTSDGTSGAELNIYHNSSTPANNDVTSLINFSGNDSGLNSVIFSRISGISTNVVDGNEDGAIAFSTRNAGTFAERVRINSDGKLIFGNDSEHYIEKNTVSPISGASVESTVISGRNLYLYAYDNVLIRAGTADYVAITAGGVSNLIYADTDTVKVERPLQQYSDSGTKQYTHLCTGSLYQGTGLTVIETNIPAHDQTDDNANMFMIKILGYCYGAARDGIIDFNVGCYAGENNYYNVSYSCVNMPAGWVGKVYVAKNNSTGKVAIILGDTSTNRNYEIAVTNFVQGFANVNDSYAKGWSISTPSNTSGYSNIVSATPTNKSPKPGFHARRTTSYSVDNTTTGLVYDNVLFDRNGNYNNSTGRFTAPFPGQYQFYAQVESVTTGVYVGISFYKNGSAFSYSIMRDFSTDSRMNHNASMLIDLDTSDYVDVRITTQGNVTFDNHGIFTGFLVG